MLGVHRLLLHRVIHRRRRHKCTLGSHRRHTVALLVVRYVGGRLVHHLLLRHRLIQSRLLVGWMHRMVGLRCMRVHLGLRLVGRVRRNQSLREYGCNSRFYWFFPRNSGSWLHVLFRFDNLRKS
jgi:hypothetical protein